jgi:hypothetical protein
MMATVVVTCGARTVLGTSPQPERGCAVRRGEGPTIQIWNSRRVLPGRKGHEFFLSNPMARSDCLTIQGHEGFEFGIKNNDLLH